MHSKRGTYQLWSAFQKQRVIAEAESEKHVPWKGLVLASLAAFFYSFESVCVKYVKNLHPLQLSLYKFIILFCMCLPEVVKFGKNPFGPKDVRFILSLRSVLGGISVFLTYTSYRFLPLGEAFIINSSGPIFVTILSCILLKEPCGIFQSILVPFAVIGIIFTTKVPCRLMKENEMYKTEHLYGILAAIGGLVSTIIKMLIVRKAKKADHSAMMFSYSFISICEIVVPLFLLTEFKWHRCGIDWFYILLIGVNSYGCLTCITLSLKCEFAGPVSTLMSIICVILAFLWQIIIFQDIPDSFSITGAVIVGLSVLLTAFGKYVSSLPENSPQRQRLRWVMA